MTPLTLDTPYEFIVRAVGNDEGTVSISSNTASGTPKAGFTMPRLYHPIKVGDAFSYQLSTTTGSTRSSWEVTGLPAGLSFNDGTGLITGTPTVSGIFQCPLKATFANGTVANVTLSLRVLRDEATPLIATPLPNITVGLNAPFTLNLAEKITDADAELAVRLATTKGDIDVMLFPSIAPNAVTNYLSYVLSGDYNGMAFHRLISGFVLQGGSLRAVATPRSFSSISQRVISPINEPGVSNLPGTLCAAKVGARNSFFTPAGGSEVARDDAFGYVGDPNSATTDFFINLADNAANLDNQNGGFTAFGRVTTAGMSVVNTIAALPTGSYTGDKSLLVDGSLVPFSAVPMNDAVAPADMDANKTVRVLSATLIPTQTYSFSSTAANIASVEVENFNLLKITGLAAGTRTVTLTARDLDGKTINQDFTITVTPGHLAPAITKQPLPATVTTGAKATFSVTATGTSLTYQWRRGGADLPGKTTATLVIDNVQAGNTGLYDVLVSNATTTLTSTPALLSIRTRTDITGALPSRLLDVGTALELEATVTGFPTPTFTWKRGTTAIKGQTTQKLSIPAVKLTDAGLYSATATNTAGSDTTTISKVCIVDKAVQTVVAAPNKLVKLTAPLAGPFESYRWRFNGVDIPLNTAGMSGFTTPTLTITSVRFDIDSGDYTCRAVAPDGLGASVSGIVRLAVSNAPILSLLTLTDSPPLGIVGNGYQFAIPYLNVAANMPTSFVISGLPPGLSYQTTTGIIFGRPTKA
ncbi:MAG: immunoglobulin domain-containing protein, partial [Prosthecobacter sp.]